MRRWGEKFEVGDDQRVGVCWTGAAQDQRSLPLALLAPLAKVKKVRLYSLQVGPAASQARKPPMPLIDLTEDVRDFADTAALIANLDLIVSVDTAVAHLAGAMAKPVWTLLALDPGWLWTPGRLDSPWYPTMRLCRQGRAVDWRGVVKRVVEALKLAALKPSDFNKT